MSDLDQDLERLSRSSEGLRARPGFNDQVMLAALGSAVSPFNLQLPRALGRMLPVAILAACISVVWAVVSENATDDAFAAADETVEIQW